jgi:hypothetical protein
MKQYRISDFQGVVDWQKLEDKPETVSDAGVILVQVGPYSGVFSSFVVTVAVRRYRSRIKLDDIATYPEFVEAFKKGEEIKIEILERCKPENLRLTEFLHKKRLTEEGVHLLNPDVVHVIDTLVPVRYQKTIKSLVDALLFGGVREDSINALINIPK